MSNVRVLPLNSKLKRESLPAYVGQEVESVAFGEGIVLRIRAIMKNGEEAVRKVTIRYRNDQPGVVRIYKIKMKDFFKNAA